MVPHRLCSRWS